MIRKRIEETDDEGRIVTTVVEEEPEGQVVDEYAEQLVHHGPYATVASLVSMLAWWVGLVGLAVLALLALRLGFEMGDANPANDFVDFIYDITGPLVQPLQGIADARTLDGGGIFYPETAIAMGVYLVATALTMMVIGALAGMLAAADQGPSVHRTRMVRGH